MSQSDWKNDHANEAGKALGIDPDELRYTPEEAEASMLSRARKFVEAGKPVLRVDEHGVTRLD